MTAKGWKGGTYGVRVGKSNAAEYFSKDWDNIDVEIDGQLHNFALSKTFWTTCPEFRGDAIKRWLLKHKLADWKPRHPPKLVVTPLGEKRFRLSF